MESANEFYGGVRVNETLEMFINKINCECDEMNEVSNWTKEMEERYEILDKQLVDLLDARIAYQLQY